MLRTRVPRTARQMSLRTRGCAILIFLVVVASNVLVAVTTTTDNAALSVSLPRMWGRSPGSLGRDKGDAPPTKHTDSPVGRARMVRSVASAELLDHEAEELAEQSSRRCRSYPPPSWVWY